MITPTALIILLTKSNPENVNHTQQDAGHCIALWRIPHTINIPVMKLVPSEYFSESGRWGGIRSLFPTANPTVHGDEPYTMSYLRFPERCLKRSDVQLQNSPHSTINIGGRPGSTKREQIANQATYDYVKSSMFWLQILSIPLLHRAHELKYYTSSSPNRWKQN